MQLKLKAMEALVKKQERNLTATVQELEEKMMKAAEESKADMRKIMELLEA